MKKTKVALNKLALNKEKVSALSPEQQYSIEGGRPPESEGFCVSGSGCDCQRATCGINQCVPPSKELTFVDGLE